MNPSCRPAGFAAACCAAAVMLVSCDKARKLIADVKSKAEKTAPADAEWITEINADGFDAFRLQNDKVVIVDFHAPWCGPCRQLAPLLQEIAAEHKGEVVIGKINVDDHPDLAASEGVSGIPDIRIYRNGGMVDKLVGLPPPSELKQRVATQVEARRASATAASQNGTAAPAEPEPAIRPMTENWLPPGIERR